MIYKGVVSATTDGGKKVAVTPHGGGIVTSWLVVPFYLIGQLPVGTTVIYTRFDDNTGIILHREDGAGIGTGTTTDDLNITAYIKDGVLVVDCGGDSRVTACIEDGVLVFKQVVDCGLSACIEDGVLCVRKDGTGTGGGGSAAFTTDDTLSLSPEGVLSVNTADEVEQDNTLPVTSAAVHGVVGDVEALLRSI